MALCKCKCLKGTVSESNIHTMSQITTKSIMILGYCSYFHNSLALRCFAKDSGSLKSSNFISSSTCITVYSEQLVNLKLLAYEVVDLVHFSTTVDS